MHGASRQPQAHGNNNPHLAEADPFDNDASNINNPKHIVLFCSCKSNDLPLRSRIAQN